MEYACIYRYEPTGHGIRYESPEPFDPERSTPCVLYPDNRRELLFDPEELCDCATFTEPTLPPKGIKAVILAGETAVLDGRIVNGRLGKPIRRQRRS